MKTTLPFASILLAGVFAFSCKTSTILRTNFNAEAVGATPAHNIPGSPDGDRIEFISELNPGLKIREWDATSKALEFSYVSTPGISGHYNWLTFKGISSNFAQTVWYIYSAKHEGNYGEVLTDLSAGSGGYIARMKIAASGQVSLIGRDWVRERVIGNIPPGTIHSVIFTVNIATSSYNLLITMPGRDRIQVMNEPTITANPLDFPNPANPSIHFNFGQGSGQGNKYTVQSISITRKQPE